MIRYWLLVGVLFLIACASTTENPPSFNMSEEAYEEATESYSAHSQKYDGPYNILEVNATLMNSQVIEAQTLRQATLFQWDKTQYQTEFDKKITHAKEKTEIFISFFTPDKKSGDLLRTDTLWKIILKFDNKEFTGVPKKLSLIPIEIKSLYPRHNRWSTGYMVTFNVPVAEVEKNNSALVITGPVGVATLSFPAIKTQ